jgi:hypothetical protein
MNRQGLALLLMFGMMTTAALPAVAGDNGTFLNAPHVLNL